MFWKKWLSDNKTSSSKESQADTISLGDAPIEVEYRYEKHRSEDGLPNDLRAVVVSDVGRVRTNNEDSARFVRPSKIVVRERKGFLAVVADGMGGHAAGEIASLIAVETVVKTYYQQDDTPESSLFVAFSKANRAIWQAANRNLLQKGMGTTCTAVAICQNQLFVAHVGDSRLYLFKNGQLFQLSTDHTYLNELVQQGVITPEQAEKHPERYVLTRAMGTHNQVEIDVFQATTLFENDDRLMLCSDGLHDYFSQEEIANFLTMPLLKEAAKLMVDTAKQRGGHDNITVLLVEKVDADEFQPARPTENIDTP